MLRVDSVDGTCSQRIQPARNHYGTSTLALRGISSLVMKPEYLLPDLLAAVKTICSLSLAF